MIKLVSKGNWDKTYRFLKNASLRHKFPKLAQFGKQGVEILSSATPVDSGETAAAWRYEIQDDGSGVPVGYVMDGGKSCTITNATGLITIPAMIEQVNIYAKDNILNFLVADGSSPVFMVYASNAAGGLEIGGGWGLNLTPLFTKQTRSDGETTISLALNPDAV